MTQYRLDKSTDTLVKYNPNTCEWEPTTVPSNTPPGGWEPVADSPLVHVTTHALTSSASAADALILSDKGHQSDDAQSVARGTLIRSAPIIAITLPVSIGVNGTAWALGIMAFPGFAAYAVTVLAMWGVVSLGLYIYMARTDQHFSYYGTEHHKIDAHERIAHHEITVRERLALQALEAHERMELRRLGLRS